MIGKKKRRFAYLTAASIALWLARDALRRGAGSARQRLAERRRGGRDTVANPTDDTTVTELVAAGREQGFGDEFVLAAQGIRCRVCGEVRPAGDYAFESLRRLEGASDPDDAQAVLAVHCPVCDAAGTLVVNYGPAASEEEADALAAMQDARDRSGIPTGTAPGEQPTSN
jgi:hypothetical protein